MANNIPCPPSEKLRQLLQGEIADEQSQVLEEHLADCAACARTVESLGVNDTLTQVLRGGGEALEQATQAVAPDLLAKLQKLPDVSEANTVASNASDATDFSATSQSYDFLAPPQTADELGRLGPYRVLKVLGRGGMGMVFQAEDGRLHRSVALKVMLPEMAQKPGAKDRFLREARAAAALEHDHIVAIYQVDEDRGVPFIAMPLLKGMSLEDYLKKRERLLSLPQILKIGREMARGLAAAHERGLIHRDIKPANVWLDANAGGRVKILDFGLARLSGGEQHLTQVGVILGTPAYMAPEQARGERVDARADLFSLGVMLYRLCTGELPFKGTDTVSTLVAVAMNEPPPPCSVNEQIPPALSDLVMKLLVKDASQRFGSAQEVLAALQTTEKDRPADGASVGQTFLSGITTTADATLEPPLQRRDARAAGQRSRRRLLVALVAALLLLPIAWWLAGAIHDPQDDKSTEKVAGDNAATVKQDIAFDAPAVRTTAAAFPQGFKTIFRQAYAECVAFSPDGRRVACAGWRGMVQVWDVATGEQVQVLQGHSGDNVSITSVDYSPDGNVILSASNDKTIKLWDARTGQEIRTLKGPAAAIACADFGPDGRIVSGSGSTVKVWNAETGRELRSLAGHSSTLCCVAFSPDGKRIASGSRDKTLKMWDAERGEEIFTAKNNGAIDCLAFSPDGRRIVAGGGWNNTALVFDAATGKELLKFSKHSGPVGSVAFHPDNKRIVSCSGGSVKVWDAATGEVTLDINGRFDTTAVASVAFNRDGTRIVGGGHRILKVWDADTGKELLSNKGHRMWVTQTVFSPDGQRIASSSFDNTLKIWDVATGQEIRTLRGHTGTVRSLAFSPDGEHLISGSDDMTLKMWVAATGKLIRTLKGHSKGVNSVAFSPDSSRIVSGSGDKMAKVWDAADGRDLLTLAGHTEDINCVAFSPDSKQVVSGSRDASLKIWDASTGQELHTLTGHTMWVTGAAFSPDGMHIVSCSRDNSVRLWDAATGQELRTFASGHSSYVSSVDFSRDGQYILSGSYDKTLKIWDATTGQLIRTFKDGHREYVQSAALAPDGRRIVSSSLDEIVLWDLDALQRIDAFAAALKEAGYPRPQDAPRALEAAFIAVEAAATPGDVAFAPDGQSLAFAEGGNLHLLDLADGRTRWSFSAPSGKAIQRIIFSPDGKTIAAQGHESGVMVVSTADGKSPGAISRQPYSDFAFDAKGRLLYLMPDRDAVKVLDARTEESLARVEVKLPPFGKLVRFASNGDSIAHTRSLGDGKYAVSSVPVAKGAETRSTGKFSGPLLDFAVPRSGVLQAVEVETPRKVHAYSTWDLATGKEIFRRAIPSDTKWHFSSTGQLVALHGQNNDGWRISNADTGTDLDCPLPSMQFTRLAFSPDDRHLAYVGKQRDSIVVLIFRLAR